MPVTAKVCAQSSSKNYHIRSDQSSTADTNYADCGPWMPNVGPYCTGNVIRFGVVEDLEKAFAAQGDKIAAYIVEPVQGHAGCIAASDEYLVAVRDLCTKYRVLFIADEIQGGLGRAGSLFSYQSSGVKPDMVVLGKSLSGGLYPVSGIVGTEEAMSGLEAGQYVATTYRDLEQVLTRATIDTAQHSRAIPLAVLLRLLRSTSSSNRTYLADLATSEPSSRHVLKP
jgi:ornithine--oxo-acid transaminase